MAITAQEEFKRLVEAAVSQGIAKPNAVSLGLKSLNGAQTRRSGGVAFDDCLRTPCSYNPGRSGCRLVVGEPDAQISEPKEPGDAVVCVPAGEPAPKPARKAAKAKAVKRSAEQSPTVLAREKISRGASDDTIMEAVKAAFGKDSKKPVLFTRADLKRLRARVKKA